MFQLMGRTRANYEFDAHQKEIFHKDPALLKNVIFSQISSFAQYVTRHFFAVMILKLKPFAIYILDRMQFQMEFMVRPFD